ncbi:MAG TPA: ABC transporter permease [Thermoanaerobaculia bacterium]
MSTVFGDLKFAARTLGRSPGFAATAILTLALGIGAATALFSAVNALLLRPLPFPRPDRLFFGLALREGFDPFGTSLLEYAAYKENAASLASTGLSQARSFQIAEQGEPERLSGAAVSADYLETVGVAPLLGRRFAPEEDRPGGPNVVLLSHGLWQRRFGADRSAIGRSIHLDGSSFTVIGVLPQGFDLPYGAEVWVPLRVHIPALSLAERTTHGYDLVARLAPGATRDRADSELKAIASRLERDFPEIRRGWSYTLVEARAELLGDFDGRTRRSLAILTLAVAFLLVICCANVANLLLVRGIARESEMAIRISLGAGRGRLLRQLLTESLLLAVLGGAAGILVANWTLPLLSALNPIRAVSMAAFLTDFHIDRRALLASVLVTMAAGLSAGILPAWRAARLRNLSARVGPRQQPAGGGGRSRVPISALVVGEIAISTALLFGGSLMLRSFQRLQKTDLGFRPERVLTMQLPLSRQKYADHARRAAFEQELLARVRALPGVVSAGMTTNLPLDPVSLDSVYVVEGRPNMNPASVPITGHRLVSPGYLETLGVTLEAGRLFDERDRADTLPTAVVSREFARQAWPGESPLGKRIRRELPGYPDTPWLTVAGVVGDTKEDRFNYRIDRPVWYLPYAQQPLPLPVELPLNLAVRVAGDAAGVAAALRGAVRAVDPAQPIMGVANLDERLAEVLLPERFGAVLMGALAAIGLLLAGIGLYGLLAFSVRQRIPEIGVRIAMGARPRDVAWLVMGRGLALLGTGLALGLLAARILTHWLSSSLYRVSAADPLTLAAVGVTLTAVSMAACYLPARRASRVDPMEALRS